MNNSKQTARCAFRVDISAIKTVKKEDHVAELEGLDIAVYDQKLLDNAIISQVNNFANNDDLEDGEINENDCTENENNTNLPHSVKKNNPIMQLEKYLKQQLELTNRKRKKTDESTTDTSNKLNFKNGKNKKTLSQTVSIGKLKNSQQGKIRKKSSFKVNTRSVSDSVETKKKKRIKSESLSSSVDYENLNHSNEEVSVIEEENIDTSSEYKPSDDDEIVDRDDDAKSQQKRGGKRRKKKLKEKISKDRKSSEESEWDYSDDEAKRKKSKKELDDGDLVLFDKRIKLFNKNNDLPPKNKSIDGSFRCPLYIWNKLYEYQHDGVKWLWELDRNQHGGILGDEMGLGKTIQLIAFLAGLHNGDVIDEISGYHELGPTIIICPTTVMHQWVREFHTWYPPIRVAILHDSGTFTGNRCHLISSISKHGGILVTSYATLINYRDYLIPLSWHYVILDEGHKIRNPDSKVTEVAKGLQTLHRIILSGSPLQNNLKEFWSLVDFVCPDLLQTQETFLSTFATPIQLGGYSNASKTQVLTGYKCAETLKKIISPYFLRRSKGEVDVQLPPKTEQVLLCKITEEQRIVYKAFLETLKLDDIRNEKAQLFKAITVLRKICNHPDLYTADSEKDLSPLMEENKYCYWRRSGKMIVLSSLLKHWLKIKNRVLLFSQGIKMLQVLEDFIKENGYKYLRLDGTTSIASRQPLIDKFNKDDTYFIMLLTTRVGGLGINLTGANKVVIFDPDWNPATDTQARERSWRIGQTKTVTVFRLISAGTIEEKIYHRQVFKTFLSNKILKNPKQRRFFATSDLYELFTLNETISGGTTETAAIFAGTGSEVKLDKKLVPIEPYNPQKESEIPVITFSKSKREEMKKQAQSLSKRISELIMTTNPEQDNIETDKAVNNEEANNNDIDTIYGPDGQLIMNNKIKLNDISIHLSENNNNNNNNNDAAIEVKDDDKTVRKNRKSKKKKNRRKKEKFVKFEGEMIPYLCKVESGRTDDNNRSIKMMSQDEYVLQKLFKKSDLETALTHDTIMGDGPNDYLIAEAEAENVAKDALIKITRNNQFESVNLHEENEEDKKLMKWIIKKIRENVDGNISPKASRMALDLIYYFKSQGGTATSEQVVNEFEKKIEIKLGLVFKSILKIIAKFSRDASKIGKWTLKNDFKNLPLNISNLP